MNERKDRMQRPHKRGHERERQQDENARSRERDDAPRDRAGREHRQHDGPVLKGKSARRPRG